MNNRRLLYYPVVLYALLLFFVWVASWIMGIAELLIAPSLNVENLLSAEGMRWALRTAAASVDAAPWASAVTGVTAVGLLYGSGFLHSMFLLFERKPFSHSRIRAFSLSLAVLLALAVLVAVMALPSVGVLSGVTDNILSSPIVKGWQLLLLLAALCVSVMHGAVYGSYRNVFDIMDGVIELFHLYAPAFVAMIPASGIIPSLVFIGVGSASLSLMEALLYGLPFIYITVLLICGYMKKGID